MSKTAVRLMLVLYLLSSASSGAEARPFSDDTLFSLSTQGALHKIVPGALLQLIPTPDSIEVTKILFRNGHEGIIAGNIKSVNAGGNSQATDPPIFRGLMRTIFKKRPHEEFRRFKAGKHYLEGKPHTNHIAAYTSDAGKTWTSVFIPTNFQLTDIAAGNSNYYISTFAEDDHLDGDIWLIQPGKGNRACLFGANRALFGMTIHNGTLVAFGSDRVLAFFPKTQMANTQGEILSLAIDNDTVKDVAAIDIPGENKVSSLTYTNDSVFWFIANGKVFRQSGKTSSQQYPITDAGKIIFVDSNTGFVLTQHNRLKYTKDGGKNWRDYVGNESKIMDIKQHDQSLALLSADGLIKTISVSDLQ